MELSQLVQVFQPRQLLQQELVTHLMGGLQPKLEQLLFSHTHMARQLTSLCLPSGPVIQTQLLMTAKVDLLLQMEVLLLAAQSLQHLRRQVAPVTH
jgi:hypothetical protein